MDYFVSHDEPEPLEKANDDSELIKCASSEQVEIMRPSPPMVTGKVLFTDEHIPNQTTKLLVDAEATKAGAVAVTADLLEESQQAPTVQQKYDLVSNHSSSKKKQ